MTAYIIRRMLFLIPLLLGLSIVMFTIIRLAPGDPALAMMSPTAASNPQYLEQTRKNLQGAAEQTRKNLDGVRKNVESAVGGNKKPVGSSTKRINDLACVSG